MELETINKLYLELSPIATAETAKEIELKKMVANRDQLTVADLILRHHDGTLREISSCLSQDFEDQTHSFNVLHRDMTQFRITVKVEEI